jgi:hypothetical protein
MIWRSATKGQPRSLDRLQDRAGSVTVPRHRGRFVLARICLRHGCRLLDRWPRCRRSWAPERVTRLQPLTACHACGADLAPTPTQGVTPDEAWRRWAIENRLLEQINDPRTGSRSVEGTASLDALLREAGRALRRPTGRGTAPTI